jgi:hypothetical protein
MDIYEDEYNQHFHKMSGNHKHEASRLYHMISKAQLASTICTHDNFTRNRHALTRCIIENSNGLRFLTTKVRHMMLSAYNALKKTSKEKDKKTEEYKSLAQQLSNTTKREQERTTWRDKALNELTAAKSDLQQHILNMQNTGEWIDIGPAWKAVQDLTNELTDAETMLVAHTHGTITMTKRCRVFQETMKDASSASP